MPNNATSLPTQLRRGFNQLPYLTRALALVWAASRGWTVAWVALLVIQGLLPAATVYLTRALVNNLVAVVDSGGSWATLRPALLLGLAVGGWADFGPVACASGVKCYNLPCKNARDQRDSLNETAKRPPPSGEPASGLG